MSILSILKNIFKSQAEETPVTRKKVGTYSNLHLDNDVTGIHDLMIVAGTKTLILISDKRRVGLWMTAGAYDPCSGSISDGHNQMNQFIKENLEEVYESLLYPLEENVFFLNITDCTNRGNLTSESQMLLYNEMQDVFFPIIHKFVEENATNRNLCVIVIPGNRGTSISAGHLCHLLSEQRFNIHVLVEELPDFLADHSGNCIQEVKTHLLNNYNTIIHKDNSFYKKYKSFTYQSICDTFCRDLRSSLIKIAQKENLWNPDEPKKTTDTIEPMVPFPSISRNAEKRLSQYGQVRTLADIVKFLNDKNRYTDIGTLLLDFRNTIDEYISRGTIDYESYSYIAYILRTKSETLFESSFLDLDKLISLSDDIRKNYGFTLDDIYSRRAKTQLLRLINLLNEIKHYTNSQDLISDLKSVMQRVNLMCNTFGCCPLCFFEMGIKNIWDAITPNGHIDNYLLEKYMFTDHERKIAELGLNEVIRMDFNNNSCHSEVFLPNVKGTAPVYVRDDNFQEPCTGEPIYIKSCGDGVGPNRGFEYYEFQLIKHILEDECEKGNYVFMDGFYIPIVDYRKQICGDDVHYIPKTENTRPILQDWYGRMKFIRERDKCQFIADTLCGKVRYR